HQVLLDGLSFSPFSTPLYAQFRRLLDPPQLLSPELFRRAQILLSQPHDVVPVGPYPAHFHLGPPAVSFIELEDFADDQLPAPTVEQDVMVSPNEVVCLFRHSHQPKLHQWRLRQIAALLTICP